jgi:hypothetical protein
LFGFNSKGARQGALNFCRLARCSPGLDLLVEPGGIEPPTSSMPEKLQQFVEINFYGARYIKIDKSAY